MAGLQDTSPLTNLPSATVDEIAKQATPQYASAAARDADATLTAALREGLTVKLLDTNCETTYTGSGWSTDGPKWGAPVSWTPAVVQSGAVASTNSDSTYFRNGREIRAKFYVTITGTGSVGNVVTVSLPVTASGTAGMVGTYHLRDNSTGNNWSGFLKLASTTTVNLLLAGGYPESDAYFGTGSTTNIAVAANDYIMGELRYTAAADA